jgi:membrane protein DedA with SNARE-associated domain
VKLAPDPAADGEVHHAPPVKLLAAAALVAVAGYGLVLAGVVELPDFPRILRDISDTLGPWTYALVGALAFLETGAFVGLIAPGETALALGGVVAAAGDISLWVMIPIAWVCAAAGDLTSFMLGRKLGTGWLDRHGARFGITIARRRQVERFLDRHGPRAVIIGRFVGIVRAVAPFLFGSSGMKLRTFLPFSILGTGVWAAAFTVVGYVFHESFEKAAETLAHGALALAAVATVVLLARAYVLRRRSRAAAG